MNRLKLIIVIVSFTLIPAVSLAAVSSTLIIPENPTVPTKVLAGGTIDIAFSYTVTVSWSGPVTTAWKIILYNSEYVQVGPPLAQGYNNYPGDGNPVTYGPLPGMPISISADTEPGPYILKIETFDGTTGYDTIEVAIEVFNLEIDIKPGSTPNTINLGSNGVIPVAILSSAYFDALTIDPMSIRLEGAAGVRVKGNSNPLAIERDVNGDGYIDLEVKIEAENLEPGSIQDGYAELTILDSEGEVLYWGSDEVTIVPQGE